MSFRYLYYPDISIPNDTWLRRVLLYSESIASIVPYDLNPVLNNYDIELLRDEREYNPLSPEDFFYQNDLIQDFELEVQESFNSKHFQKILENEKRKSRSLIYKSKFTHEIFNFLRNTGLYQEGENKWGETPKVVGDLYLGILAKYMGHLYSYTPTSNSVRAQEIAFYNSPLTKQKIGEIRLIQSLPNPTDDTSISDLLRFKNKRKQELLKFRAVLRENITQLSSANCKEEIDENIQIFKEKLEIEVNELSILLRENRINFALGSLKSLVPLDQNAMKTIGSGKFFCILKSCIIINWCFYRSCSRFYNQNP